MISTRHIRHDWRTFVDSQNQNTVMTLCGKKSKPHLSGIPGITEQDLVVQKRDRAVWGWCIRCVESAGREINALIESGAVSTATTSPEILAMYARANAIIHPARVRVSIFEYRKALGRNPETNVRPITSPPVI